VHVVAQRGLGIYGGAVINRNVKTILWFIWGAMMCALPFYKIFLGGGDRVDSFDRTIDLFAFGLFAVPLVVSVFIRWLILPKLRQPALQLAPFVAGLAVAESLIFFGKFLVPEYDSVFFYTGVLAMAQFMPVFLEEPPVAPPPPSSPTQP
jgi:hypothetical protein